MWEYENDGWAVDMAAMRNDILLVNAVMDRAWEKYITPHVPINTADVDDWETFRTEMASCDAATILVIEQRKPLLKRILRRARRAHNFTISPNGGFRHSSWHRIK